MKIAIEVQKLHKHYESFHALKGIDLSVRHREIFGFLGPNGAGKTTTIRCLLDLIRPSSGTVKIFDVNPQKKSVHVKKLIGYLPGELNLDDRLTARQSLSLFAALRNHRVNWEWIEEHADKLKLKLDTKIKNFSKGNKQKVGIIQAFMHQPQLLILDEPTSGLDPLMQKQVLQMVTAARANGATVFFSSHILSEVEEVSDRVAIIRDGIIIDTAVVQNLIAKNVRCVTITCEQQINVDKLCEELPHVKLLNHKQNTIVLQVEKDLAKVIDYCSAYTIKDFVTKEPSLEEIFLTYYHQSKGTPMLPIFNHNFKRLVPQIFGWGIGLAFYCAVVLCFFHVVSDNASEIQKLIESLPKALTSLIGDLNKFNTPEGYMSIRIFGVFPLLLGVFAIICGSGLLLRDEEQGFLDLMMGYPISRKQIFFARLSSLVVAIIGILLIIWLGIAIGIWVSELNVAPSTIFFPLTSLFAIVCCFATLSLFLSMVLPSRIAATMTSGLIMLITQMISNLAKLSATLQPIALLSPFEYYQGVKAIEQFDAVHFMILITATIIFAMVAFLYFTKRDIRVAGEGDMNWAKFTLATIATLVIFVYTLISLTRDISQISPANCFKTTIKSIEEKNWKKLTKCINKRTKKQWCASALLRGSFLVLDVGDKGAIRMWQNSDQRLDVDSIDQQQAMQSIIQMQIAIANVDLKILRRNLEIILRYPSKLFLTEDEVEKLASAVKNKDAFIHAVLRATSGLRELENFRAVENIQTQDKTATAIAVTSYEQKIPISFTKNKTKWRIHLPPLSFVTSMPAAAKSSEDDLGDYMLYENIVYDTQNQLLLDAYIPQNSQDNPGILLVHGGGWRTGDKEQLAKYAHFLASNNFACFAISYRLAPQSMFPAQIDDCRTALTWLKNNATNYKVNPEKIGAVGYSAGGHLVSLLATTNDKSDLKLRVVVAGGAPTDFTTLSDEVTNFRYLFGDLPSKVPHLYRQASPAVQVSSTTCPIGLFHGQEDMLVSLDGPLTPIKLYKKLQQLQIDTELETIATTGHFEAIYHQKSLDFTLRFLQKHLQKQESLWLAQNTCAKQ